MSHANSQHGCDNIRFILITKTKQRRQESRYTRKKFARLLKRERTIRFSRSPLVLISRKNEEYSAYCAGKSPALRTDGKPIAKDWEDLYSGLQLKTMHGGTEEATGNEARFHPKDPFPVLSLGEVGDEDNHRLADGPKSSLGEGFGIHKILAHGNPIFAYHSRLSLWSRDFLCWPFRNFFIVRVQFSELRYLRSSEFSSLFLAHF